MIDMAARVEEKGIYHTEFMNKEQVMRLYGTEQSAEEEATDYKPLIAIGATVLLLLSYGYRRWAA